MTGKQSSVTDIKVIPSDALDSNHGLLVMNMRVGNEYKSRVQGKKNQNMESEGKGNQGGNSEENKGKVPKR